MARHHITDDDQKSNPQSHTTRDVSHSSSALSPCAQPHEDWTKITDLAERRRIQNRIAQRNYRKKLKQKMGDLDNKASISTSTRKSPPSPTRSVPTTHQDRRSRSRSPSLEASALIQPDDGVFQFDDTSDLVVEAAPTFTFPTSDSHVIPYTSTTQRMPFFSYPGPDEYSEHSGSIRTFGSSPYGNKPPQSRTDSIFDVTVPMATSGMFTSISHMANAPTDSSSTCSLDLLDLLEPPFTDMYDMSGTASPGDLGGYPLTPSMIPLSPHFVSFEL